MIITRPSRPVEAIQRARGEFRKAAIRRQIQSVAAGKTDHIPADAAEPRHDAASTIEEISKGLREDSLPLQLLQVAFKNSNVADQAIENLAVKSIGDRVAGARLVGSLRMYDATSWVAPLLFAKDPSVADAGARALGRIGGVNSASALVAAIQRRGISRRRISELARSAPDLFLESAIEEADRPVTRPALAIAAGLRRRRTAISPLLKLLERGSRKERVISCRALGWIGAANATPAIVDLLSDHDWKLRMSAAKALGALRAQSARPDLERLHDDRNPRVRTAAKQAIRRIEHGA
ncbi:MAG TPA: HEAT repeat domain-containing protein [Candidatus Dormibacteraeota bacterium]|nr:HEAT repeat domain-containing protein [Candidatus Dormibacteraeota bacterium]